MIKTIEQLQNVLSSFPKEGDPPQVTNQTRSDWNNYTKWLQKRGMSGDPKLDTNNLGNNMLKKYIAENPETTLTPELVAPIQHDFANLRHFLIDNVKKNKGEFAPGVTEDNFMQELSQVDGYPGSLTSKHSFPSEYMNTFQDGKLVDTENKGFVTSKN